MDLDEKKEDLDIKFDSKRVKEIIKKYNLVLLILIPLLLSIYFRAYPYDLPLTDNIAKSSIEGNIKAQIQNSILSQNDNIDQSSLDTLVEQRYQSFVNTNKEEVEQQTNLLSQQIKDYYSDENGLTYILSIDPYHYIRYAENILNKGHIGDEVVDGKQVDTYSIAPIGKDVDNENYFIPYTIVLTHKFYSIFSDPSVYRSSFLFPILLSALSVIPMFFIARKVSGNFGGFLAAFILAIHPVFLGRTTAGAPDTDPQGIFFPLFIVWFFLEAFTAEKNKNKLIFGGLAGLFTGIFAFAWPGWWYIFYTILGSLGVYAIYLFIKYKKEMFKKIKTKNLLKISGAYIISSAIFVDILTGFGTFLNSIKSPFEILFLKQAVKPDLWPNVYTTVAELNEINISGVISQLGGNLLFFLSLVGILAILIKRNKTQLEIKYGILMIIWYLVTLYTTTKGIRFVMFIVPLYALGLGIFFSKAYALIGEWASKSLQMNKKLLSISLIIIIMLTFIPLVKSADNTATSQLPLMNDAWYTSLQNIKDSTQEDTIITSWWDFGHFFKQIADRPVTFDGASQNRPQAHWVGKVLLTDNEQEAVSILRMLNCGGNNAYDYLLKETNDPVLTKKIIDEIILLDKESARQELEKYSENADEIIEQTHCALKNNVLITSEDMVSKGGVWAHFGAWDFEKAFIVNELRTKSKNNFITSLEESLKYSEEDAEKVYNEINKLSENDLNAWVAPYPGYNSIGNCQEQNNTVVCSNGVIINLNNKEVKIQSSNGQVTIKNSRIDNEINTGSSGAEDFAVAYNKEDSTSIIMHPLLLQSMFTELFFYEGKYVNNFELLDHQTGIDGFDIYVWKVI